MYAEAARLSERASQLSVQLAREQTFYAEQRALHAEQLARERVLRAETFGHLRQAESREKTQAEQVRVLLEAVLTRNQEAGTSLSQLP